MKNYISASSNVENYFGSRKDDYVYQLYSLIYTKKMSILYNDIDREINKFLQQENINLRNIDKNIQKKLLNKFDKDDYYDDFIKFDFKKGVSKSKKIQTIVSEKVRRYIIGAHIAGDIRGTFDSAQCPSLLYALITNYPTSVSLYVNQDNLGKAEDVCLFKDGRTIKDFIIEKIHKIDICTLDDLTKIYPDLIKYI